MKKHRKRLHWCTKVMPRYPGGKHHHRRRRMIVWSNHRMSKAYHYADVVMYSVLRNLQRLQIRKAVFSKKERLPF